MSASAQASDPPAKSATPEIPTDARADPSPDPLRRGQREREHDRVDAEDGGHAGHVRVELAKNRREGQRHDGRVRQRQEGDAGHGQA